MNLVFRKTLIVFVIALVAVGLAGCKKKTTEGTTSSTTSIAENAQTASEEEDISGNLFDIFNSGRSMTCTWEGDMGGGVMKGTVYASDKKVRSEATGTVAGREMMAYSVGDGTKMYMWTNLSNAGTVMDYAKMQNQGSGNGQQQFDQFKNKTNYKCHGWSPDQSKFEVPTDITFQAV